MARYEINGGKPLNGTVTISGAKNAAVAILLRLCWSAGSAGLRMCPIFQTCEF